MATLSALRPARAPSRPTGACVPWGTVLTFAVALSCTGSFWLVSLTGAIGVTQRGERPFATWVMMSAALVPAYAAAVLGALTLAKRWWGPEPRGTSRVLGTGLLVLVAGTLMGIAAFVGSALYDVGIQVHHITGMPGMASCTGACVPREQHEIVALHLRGIALVSQKLLLTNAVLVAWIAAAWAGRISVSGSSPALDDAPVVPEVPPARSLRDDVRLLLGGALAGAAVIHASVVPEHLDEWPAAGLFFVVLAVLEIAVAGLLLTRPTGRRLLGVAVAVSAVPLVVWVWSRTLGLPFGPQPGAAEVVGVPDALACLLEIGALVAALSLLAPRRVARPALSAHVRGLAVLVLLAVATIGFAATGPAWFDAFGVAASHSAMEMNP
jgi:hypothetical protein